MKAFKVETIINDEYFEDGPTHAVIKISPELKARINILADIVRKNQIYKIEEFNSLPEYKIQKSNGRLYQYKERIDCLTLDITENDFRWTGYLNHSNVMIETEPISLNNLNDN